MSHMTCQIQFAGLVLTSFTKKVNLVFVSILIDTKYESFCIYLDRYKYSAQIEL